VIVIRKHIQNVVLTDPVVTTEMQLNYTHVREIVAHKEASEKKNADLADLEAQMREIGEDMDDLEALAGTSLKPKPSYTAGLQPPPAAKTQINRSPDGTFLNGALYDLEMEIKRKLQLSGHAGESVQLIVDRLVALGSRREKTFGFHHPPNLYCQDVAIFLNHILGKEATAILPKADVLKTIGPFISDPWHPGGNVDVHYLYVWCLLVQVVDETEDSRIPIYTS
jgi:hypothetical protein